MKNIMIFGCLVLFGILTLTTTGCKKGGCTDADAENYCDNCKDDGGCEFKGVFQFWYGKATADSLIANASSSLTYYIDNVIIGSSAANVYFTGDPSCTQTAPTPVRSEIDLGSEKTKTFSYKVVDDFGDVIWTGSNTYDASVSCTSLELTW